MYQYLVVGVNSNRSSSCTYYVYVCVLFSSRVGVPGKSAGVIFTPVNTEIVSFAPELVGGQCNEILHNQKHLNNTPYVPRHEKTGLMYTIHLFILQCVSPLLLMILTICKLHKIPYEKLHT